MIKIDKSDSIPAILSDKGAIETSKLKLLFESSTDDFTSNVSKKNRDVKKFPFDNLIYGDKTVKNQLIAEQNEKCCFCEAVFNANGYGDVEHFRPKATYKSDRKLKYPAYYWFVYDWYNLMFSCQRCNQEYKGNEFPVLDENTRVKSHQDTNTISNEKHTLINPIEEDPENFICFKAEIPKPKSNLNPSNKTRALKSIKIFGLDRDKLNRDRREYLRTIKESLFISEIQFDKENTEQVNIVEQLFPNCSIEELENKIADAKCHFFNATRKISKYAGMVRSNFPELKEN